MPPPTERSLLRQATRGTLFVVAITAGVCAVALAMAILFVLVMAS